MCFNIQANERQGPPAPGLKICQTLFFLVLGVTANQHFLHLYKSLSMYMYIYIYKLYIYIYISIYVYILKTASKTLLVYHTLSFVLNANDDQNTAVTRFSWTSCRKKTFCTYWFGRISAVCDFVCSLMGAQCGVEKVPCLLNACTILHSSRVVCNVLIPRAVLLCKTSVVDWVD